ncbi:transcriptional regulator [Salmonella enterica subsp. diarizonae]|nr:transcriptional regulator [Salmonella enterica subsp. diarizonae]
MKLHEYLKINDISQRAFGQKVGATQGMVSHVLNGRTKPTGPNTILWSKATGWLVTPHEIDSSTYPNPTDGIPTDAPNSLTHQDTDAA